MSEVRAFRAALRALEREIGEALQSQTECCGVTVAQCHLLLEIAEAGEGSIGDYADRLGLDQSTLSRTTEGLVKAGLVERSPDPASRRRQLVRLSSAGRDKAKAIHARCDAEYGRMLDMVPERKRKTLLEGLQLLAEAMRDGRVKRAGSCCSAPKPSARRERETRAQEE